MEIDNFFQTKLFKRTIVIIAGLIILGFVFSMGVFIGAKRANFSFQWAKDYHRNFGGPMGGFFGDFMGMNKGIPNANGSFGKIIKIDPLIGTIIIKDASNIEKNILIDDNTTIVYQKNNFKLPDLKTGDNVVIIGEPNKVGQMHANFIRVMPAPKN